MSATGWFLIHYHLFYKTMLETLLSFLMITFQVEEDLHSAVSLLCIYYKYFNRYHDQWLLPGSASLRWVRYDGRCWLLFNNRHLSPASTYLFLPNFERWIRHNRTPRGANVERDESRRRIGTVKEETWASVPDTCEWEERIVRHNSQRFPAQLCILISHQSWARIMAIKCSFWLENYTCDHFSYMMLYIKQQP